MDDLTYYMKKLFKILFTLLMLLALLYLLGPKASFETVDASFISSPATIDNVEEYIKAKDAQILDLKPGNEGRLYWKDDLPNQKTEYVVLYLHGFSACGVEGEDVHIAFANAIGANLYIPRLVDSGRESFDTFKDITPKDLLNSAKEAIAVAKELGNKLIVVSTSTGGTYSTFLSAYDKEIYAQILLSPNIDVFDKRSDLILKPWGEKMMTFMQGGEYNEISHYSEEQKKYWNWKYHNDGIIALKSLIVQTMKEETFRRIDQPTLVIAFYQNEEIQDQVVSVPRMREFFSQISTATTSKKFIECPTCQNHVIGSKLFNANTELVLNEMLKFSKDILKIENFELVN